MERKLRNALNAGRSISIFPLIEVGSVSGDVDRAFSKIQLLLVSSVTLLVLLVLGLSLLIVPRAYKILNSNHLEAVQQSALQTSMSTILNALVRNSSHIDCHPECASCFGPNSNNCISCPHFHIPS